jgi:hypothetical protein
MESLAVKVLIGIEWRNSFARVIMCVDFCNIVALSRGSLVYEGYEAIFRCDLRQRTVVLHCPLMMAGLYRFTIMQ